MKSESPTNADPIFSSQDIWHKPLHNGTAGDEYVVYMLPGNPCIMTYYQPFLAKLFSSLNEALAPRNLSAHVGGYTLPGFRLQQDHMDGISLPASYRAQIGHSEELIKLALKRHVGSENDGGIVKRPKVILVAHSAGTYITLEILKRYAGGQNDLSDVHIVGAVLVCPTVTQLAESRNGVKANVCQYFTGRFLLMKCSFSLESLRFRFS